MPMASHSFQLSPEYLTIVAAMVVYIESLLRGLRRQEDAFASCAAAYKTQDRNTSLTAFDIAAPPSHSSHKAIDATAAPFYFASTEVNQQPQDPSDHLDDEVTQPRTLASGIPTVDLDTSSDAGSASTLVDRSASSRYQASTKDLSGEYYSCHTSVATATASTTLPVGYERRVSQWLSFYLPETLLRPSQGYQMGTESLTTYAAGVLPYIMHSLSLLQVDLTTIVLALHYLNRMYPNGLSSLLGGIDLTLLSDTCIMYRLLTRNLVIAIMLAERWLKDSHDEYNYRIYTFAAAASFDFEKHRVEVRDVQAMRDCALARIEYRMYISASAWEGWLDRLASQCRVLEGVCAAMTIGTRMVGDLQRRKCL
ncbi:hypothetical protein BKA70DRAFT_1258906 [Coprinopsis sp. MPI-PUGE-AT-0042]|nr:hypothetical protein BKA70DRAFT_1258906 [Coprinopsis sp. MPI-PUGE-AT-0042]